MNDNIGLQVFFFAKKFIHSKVNALGKENRFSQLVSFFTVLSCSIKNFERNRFSIVNNCTDSAFKLPRLSSSVLVFLWIYFHHFHVHVYIVTILNVRLSKIE